MTSINKSFLFFAGMSLYVLAACKKEHLPDQPPPVTETGSNTFGFKADGKLFIHYCKCSDIGPGIAELSSNIVAVSKTYAVPIAMNLLAQDHRQETSGFFIGVPYNMSYLYNKGNVLESLEINFIPAGGPVYKPHKYFNAGADNFTITKMDTINGILSGTFNFMVYSTIASSTSHKDSLAITDGRFDLRFGVQDKCTQ